MEIGSVLVTGANRGIGLEFVKQLVKLCKPPGLLFATYRDMKTIEALEKIRDSSKQTQIVLIKMDVTDAKDIENVRKVVEDKVGDKGLDLLINNAGALKIESFREITEDNMSFHFTTNTTGPVMILKNLFPLLEKSAALKSTKCGSSRTIALNISSVGGSMGGMDMRTRDTWYQALGYRTSKAALNMAIRIVAMTVKDSKVLVVNLCPGWVKTNLGSDAADMDPSESVSAILNTVSRLNDSHHGEFIDRHGKTIPF